MESNGQPIGESVSYLSAESAAKSLGCSASTVKRAAKRLGIGIVVDGTRLVAIAPAELPALKACVQTTSGNPDWIATRGTGPHSRFVRTKGGLRRKRGR
jgi:hypothetical protein